LTALAKSAFSNASISPGRREQRAVRPVVVAGRQDDRQVVRLRHLGEGQDVSAEGLLIVVLDAKDEAHLVIDEQQRSPAPVDAAFGIVRILRSHGRDSSLVDTA